MSYEDWIGRSTESETVLTAAPAAALAATFDRGDTTVEEGDILPPGWHVLYFRQVARLSETGEEGHPRRGGFMPPVRLQRMMWSSHSLTFLRPLRIGERCRRVSRIVDIRELDTEAGPVCSVTTNNEISGEDGLAMFEERASVFRDPPPADAPPPVKLRVPQSPPWRRTIRPNTVLLFRFSALTLNSHRIHYDRSYAMEVERYPGLVFHGSLTLLLLLELLRDSLDGVSPKTFSAHAIPPHYEPLFDNADVELLGEPSPDGNRVRLWARNGDGLATMEATAEI